MHAVLQRAGRRPPVAPEANVAVHRHWVAAAEGPAGTIGHRSAGIEHRWQVGTSTGWRHGEGTGRVEAVVESDSPDTAVERTAVGEEQQGWSAESLPFDHKGH